MVVAGLMQIVPLDTFRFAVSEYSLLQIVSPLGVALGAVFLAWLARQWESRDLDAATYPPAVGGLILHPRPSSGSRSPRCGRRSPAASSTPSASRPAPALAPSVRPSRPSRTPPSLADFVLGQYGLAFFLALAAVLYILARPLYRSDDANHTLYIPAALAVVGSVYAVPSSTTPSAASSA